jgi:hypothetical protein
MMNEKGINFLEGLGVAMRILAFGVLSIMNKDTPFLAMWIINTIDAIILTALNLFWLIVGIVGIYNSL